MIKARISLKFYIVSFVLLALVVFVWYGIYFLNANEILMEDGAPMDSTTKIIFTVLMSLIAFSWSVSLFILIRQMLLKYAFVMDEDGIHNTVTAIVILAFIVIVPVKLIPYDAVLYTKEEDGILTSKLDKAKCVTSPVFKPFMRSEYHFFSGFTSEKQENIKNTLDKYVK